MGSVLDSGTCFWILGRVFGFWEVLFGFWDVFLDSAKCSGFWEAFQFLGSVLQLSVDFRLSVLCSLGDLPTLKTSLSLINRVS